MKACPAPRSIKTNADGFRRAKDGIPEAVWEAFDIAPPTDGERGAVETADDRLLASEANRLLEDGPKASDPRNFDGIRDSYRRGAEALVGRLK